MNRFSASQTQLGLLFCLGALLVSLSPAMAQLTTYYGPSLKKNSKWELYDDRTSQGRTYWNNPGSPLNSNGSNTDGKPNPETTAANTALFKLHTRNNKHPGYFQGTELYSKKSLRLPTFKGGAAMFRAKIKLNSLPAGAVFGFYAVEQGGEEGEIDVEFLGNFLHPSPYYLDPSRKGHLWLNVHRNGAQLEGTPTNSTYDPSALSAATAETKVSAAGIKEGEWHTYTVRWAKDSISWQIDDVTSPSKTGSVKPNDPVLKRVTDKTLIPVNPLSVHFNAWVPSGDPAKDDYFPQAANSNLKTTQSGNQTFSYEVAWMQMGVGVVAKGKAKVAAQ